MAAERLLERRAAEAVLEELPGHQAEDDDPQRGTQVCVGVCVRACVRACELPGHQAEDHDPPQGT